MSIKVWIRCGYILLLLIALYNSLLATMGFTYLESDYSDTALLWQGLHQYGWPFIKTWIYAQDNWLLSLFPFHALLFAIFSPTKEVVVLSGWIIFLANVGLAAAIAWSLGAKKSAYLTPLLFLFSGQFSYVAGFMAYPISHNITNFYCLLALWAIIYWINAEGHSSRIWPLVVVWLTLIVSGFSDPWYLPCYGLPFLFSTLLLMVMHQKSPSQQNYLHLLGVLVLVLVINSFFSRADYSIAGVGQIYLQFLYLLKNLGLYINFGLIQNPIANVFSWAILLILTGCLLLKFKKRFPAAPSQQFFFFTVGFSIIILIISFCLYARGVVFDTLRYNRYFLNIFFLGILGLTVGAEIYWRSFTNAVKIGFGVIGGLYVISGLNSTLYLWKHPPTIPASEYDQLRQFLSSQGLTYGYANYWNANVITWLSGNTIRVRAVAFSVQNGQIFFNRRVQTSPLWYLPQDVPANQHRFFVYFQKNEIECPDLQLCEWGLSAQYGYPEATIPYKNGIIMVWLHPLVVREQEHEYKPDPRAGRF